MSSSRADAQLVTSSGLPASVARWWTILPLLLIAVAGLIVYSNTFSVPFLFDDDPNICSNPLIRQWWPPWPVLQGPRPVAQYTFALNYAVHGYQEWGYHAVNLAIHIACGLLLYGIARRTLSRGEWAGRWAEGLALAIALLWTVHPLQTQAVTYIVQRHESLMGLMFLSGFYAFVRGLESSRGWLWYVVSVGCCVLGLGTKEVIAALPLLVLWYDWAFVSGSWGELWRKRKYYYGSLALILVVMAVRMMGAREGYANRGVMFVEGLTPWNYLISQAGVLVHYLRLSVYPSGQCFDYGWPAARSVWEVWWQGVIVLVLLGLTLWGLVREPRWGFLGGWFFLILAPTSSFIPLRDLAVEHRMYLPLAAVIALVVMCGAVLLQKLWGVQRRGAVLGLAVLGLVAFALGSAAYARNTVYSSQMSLWSDVVAKRPENPRGVFCLGGAYQGLGNYHGALQLYFRAMELDPKCVDAVNNAGLMLELLGRPEEATRYYRRALQLDPNCAEAHLNIGKMIAAKDPQLAIEHFRRAVQIRPYYSAAHNNLAAMLENSAPELAEKHYRMALKCDPLNALAHSNYADWLARSGRYDAAVEHWQRVLQLRPDDEAARRNLAFVESTRAARRNEFR